MAWAALEVATLVLLSFGTLLVTARLLGPVDFGVAASVLAVVQFASLIVEQLFGVVLVQRHELKQEHVDTAFWTCLTVAIALVGTIWLCEDAIAALFEHAELGPTLGVASLGLLFAAYAGIQTAVLRREFGFRQLAQRTLIARIVGSGVGIGLAVDGAGAWAIIAQYVASTALGAAALWYLSPRRIGFAVRLVALRDLLGFALPCLANEALYVGHLRAWQLLASYLLGLRDFALLSLGFRLVDTLRDVCGDVAHNVGLPFFARVQDDRRALAQHFAVATAGVCAVLVPAFAGLGACAEPVVLFVLGDAWGPVVPVVQILAAAAAAGFAATFCSTVFLALGRPSLDLPRSVLDGVGSVSLLLLLADLGPTAAAAAWAAPKVPTLLLGLGLCMWLLPLRPRQLLGAIAPPVALAVVIALAFRTAERTLLAHLGAGEQLAVVIPAGAVLVALCIFALRPKLVRAAAARLPALRMPSSPVPVDADVVRADRLAKE